jgi:hypothetical protein
VRQVPTPSPSATDAGRVQRDVGQATQERVSAQGAGAYTTEATFLQHAIGAQELDKLQAGADLYTDGGIQAVGLSDSAFAVGPFTTDMGNYFYVYRFTRVDRAKKTYEFSRGMSPMSWNTEQLRKDLGSVRGTDTITMTAQGLVSSKKTGGQGSVKAGGGGAQTGAPASEETGSAPPVSSDLLETGMREVLDAWKAASVSGVHQFATAVLANKIASLESGSGKNLILSLIGNTIWAATAFFPAGMPLAVFAVAMAGIAIASMPAIPNPTKSNLPQIEDAMLDYLDEVYRQLNEQLPAKAPALIKEFPGIGRFEAIAKFIKASYQPEFRYEYIPYDKLPQLNVERVRDAMLRKATYEYEATERAEAGIKAATSDFAGLTRPLPGVKEPGKRVGGGYRIASGKLDEVASAYGNRANLDLKNPQSGFDRTFPALERSMPPTAYFYHWLSRHYLGSDAGDRKLFQSQLPGFMANIRATMAHTKAEQLKLREELYENVKERAGKDVPEKVWAIFAREKGLRPPYRAEQYEREASDIAGKIIQQLEDLTKLLSFTGKSPERDIVKEHVKI